MKKQQFELWTQCNNNCSYCYLGDKKFRNDKQEKLANMQFAIDWMNNFDHYKEYDNASFIGGEFFQGQLNDADVRKKWFSMLEVLKDRMENDFITSSWWSATLTIGDQQDLVDSLKMFEGVADSHKQIWIVTSYDTIGRFHNQKMLDTWKANLLKIKSMFPWIFINTCMIMTGDFCDKVVSGELDLYEISNTFSTSLFLKPTYAINAIGVKCDDSYMKVKQDINKRIPNFYPRREQILQLFSYLKENCPDIFEHVIEQKYRADNLYREENDGSYRNRERSRDNSKQDDLGINTCGHSLGYRCYIDCDDCIVCDKNLIGDDEW